jgi:acetyl-CoA C-acetyltransferase
MGCSKFGERWDADAEDLMVEAYTEAMAIPLATALRLPHMPVTRVENLCASGTEAFRGAVYAVAAGACDIALALGSEKLKDSGYGGLPQRTRGKVSDLYFANQSAPGSFAQLASAYRAKHGVDRAELKRAMAHISVKSHANATRNPKAHLRNAIDIETVLRAPMVAEPLGLFDCCGVSDGAACAIVTTPEIAQRLGKKNSVAVKALQLAVSNGSEAQFNDWDGSYFPTARTAAGRAYREAGIEKPREQLDLIEVHDCFSITELVTLEDLFISAEGDAVTDVLEGFYDADGRIPCQIDGGLKCFGHPVGASGLRMIYELYLQMQGRAGGRQLAKDIEFGLTHNLGGQPMSNVCSVAILGPLGK